MIQHHNIVSDMTFRHYREKSFSKKFDLEVSLKFTNEYLTNWLNFFHSTEHYFSYDNINSWLLLLSLFIGIWLLFNGVTDTPLCHVLPGQPRTSTPSNEVLHHFVMLRGWPFSQDTPPLGAESKFFFFIVLNLNDLPFSLQHINCEVRKDRRLKYVLLKCIIIMDMNACLERVAYY